MNKLQTEIDRLYLAGGALSDPQGRTRALVLEVARPADWEALRRVWLGAQAVLELAAPAIAVSGRDALQLWFSLAEPLEAAAARALLDALRVRWLADLPAKRVRLLPDAAGRHADGPPPHRVSAEHWSAFVSPDLAAVFSDTPWLDVEPGEEGQANLLRGLRSIPLAALDAVRDQPAGTKTTSAAAPAPGPMPSSAPTPASAPVHAPGHHVQAPVPAQPPTRAQADPRRFLLDVMNDETAPLALRVEAAKALLPYAGD